MEEGARTITIRFKKAEDTQSDTQNVHQNVHQNDAAKQQEGLTERQQCILQKLQQIPHTTIAKLAKDLNVSFKTIQRDIESMRKGGVFPEFRVFDLNQQIPIKNISLAEQESIVSLVEQILEAKAANREDSISVLEAQIDSLVYHLYGLTDNEIEMVEGY